MYASIIMGCHLLPCIPTIVCTLKRIDEHSLPLPQALKEPPPEETGEFVVHCKYAGWMKWEYKATIYMTIVLRLG